MSLSNPFQRKLRTGGAAQGLLGTTSELGFPQPKLGDGTLVDHIPAGPSPCKPIELFNPVIPSCPSGDQTWHFDHFTSEGKLHESCLGEFPARHVWFWVYQWIGLYKGKNCRKKAYFMARSMVSCRCSLKPIQWVYPPSPPVVDPGAIERPDLGSSSYVKKWMHSLRWMV